MQPRMVPSGKQKPFNGGLIAELGCRVVSDLPMSEKMTDFAIALLNRRIKIYIYLFLLIFIDGGTGLASS